MMAPRLTERDSSLRLWWLLACLLLARSVRLADPWMLAISPPVDPGLLAKQQNRAIRPPLALVIYEHSLASKG